MTVAVKLAAKRALGRLYSLCPRAAKRRVVLLYHSIGDSPPALPNAVFRSQIEWLTSEAELVSLDTALRRTGTAPLQVSITFDDGYASVHSAASTVLRGLGATATVFLNTGWIASETRKQSDSGQGHYPQENFMLWREVEDLAAAGWGIGSHGVDHLDLTAQPDDCVRTQLTASRARIVETLGSCSPIFSYTWGRHTPHLRQLVAEAGYTHAVAGVHGALHDTMDPYMIPRIDVAKSYTLDDFKAIVRGDWDYLAWLQQGRAVLAGALR